MNPDKGRVGFVVALLVLVHLVLHVALGLGREAPDLFPVAVLLAGRALGARGAALTGLALGLLEDAFSVLGFGAGAVSLALVGLLAGATKDLFVGDSRVFQLTYLFAGVWLKSVVFWVMSPDATRLPLQQVWLVDAPLNAAYATIVGLVAFGLAGIGEETE